LNEEETDEEQESDESIENINKSSGVRALRQLSQISNIVFQCQLIKRIIVIIKMTKTKIIIILL